jgi:non-specific serine/threonine protein kinase/serine/threonine-protein kinase
MPHPDWQLVKDTFAEAYDLPSEERVSFLNEILEQDPELYREVVSLLAASEQPDNIIENNAVDLASNVAIDEPDLTGRQFGNYRIIRELGSGGMGAVFLAERDDGQFKMQVALKVVRQSVVDSDTLKRFLAERQILADLHHPNIAALHDGGVTDSGEPFLAMEYIEGMPLTEYANDKYLSIRERLELFLKVCSAVSFAHRNLIIHRDIKPSNIIVTADGEPKLLDFGLAKALSFEANKTQTAFRAFTPAYASPEQFKGGIVTTASDIYSLGVVLYELLTGREPYEIENKSLDEMMRTLGETEPMRPSSLEEIATGNNARSELRGDLDVIVLKALRKEPERRFQTVDDMAADIRRHLEGRPIAARPNTFGYIAAKSFARNKAAFISAALILIALVAGLGVAIWQAEQARRDRDRAERRFQDVRQLSNSLLFDISPKIERLPGSVEAREMLVRRALEYLDSLSAEAVDDGTLRAELAAAYEKVGDLQGNIDRPNLSDYAGAIQSFEKARELRRTLADSNENLAAFARNLQTSAAIRNRQNDTAGSLADIAQAQDIFAKLVERNPNDVDLQLAAVDAATDHGRIFAFNNQYKDANVQYEKAVTALERPIGGSFRKDILTARLFAFYGNALSWDGRQPEAETAMAKALELSNDLIRREASSTETMATRWQVLLLASSIYEDSRNDDSLKFAKDAEAVAARRSELDAADSQAKFDLARSVSRVGIMSTKVGDAAAGAAHLTRAGRILEELIEREPKNKLYQTDLAKLYIRLGDTSIKRGDRQDALLKYQNAAVIYERLIADDAENKMARRDLAQALRAVGKTQIAIGETAAARATLARAKEALNLLASAGALGGADAELVTDVEKMLASV